MMKSGYSIPIVLILISLIFAFSIFLQRVILSSLRLVEMEELNQKIFATLESGEIYVMYHWITEPPENVNLRINGMDLTMVRVDFSNESSEALYRYSIRTNLSTLEGFLKVKKK